MGNSFASLAELSLWQDANRTELYAANAVWWDAGGYNGNTDEEAMMGDDESAADIEDSQVSEERGDSLLVALRYAARIVTYSWLCSPRSVS